MTDCRLASMASPRSNLFSSAVRQLRERAGLTRAELAGRMRVSPSYIEYIERSLRGMDLDEIVRLARVLGADPRSLLAAYLHDRSPAAYQALFPAPVPDTPSTDVPDYILHRLYALPRPVRSAIEATIDSIYDMLRSMPR